MTYVPGVDYDVCYNYPDGRIYYRDDIEYKIANVISTHITKTIQITIPIIQALMRMIPVDKLVYFKELIDEVDTYRPKWISVMWCCFLIMEN